MDFIYTLLATVVTVVKELVKVVTVSPPPHSMKHNARKADRTNKAIGFRRLHRKQKEVDATC